MQARGVTAREAKYIVAEHNELRDKVASGRETRGSIYSQPQAANMRQLVRVPSGGGGPAGTAVRGRYLTCKQRM